MNRSDGKKNTFGDRVRSISQSVGGLDQLSKLSKISKRVISSYISGDSEPTRPRLISIAQAGNVTLEWLAEGKGIKENRELNATALQTILTEVENIFHDYKITVNSEKKSKFIANLYAEMMEDGTTMEDIRKEIIRIAEMIK